MNDAKNTVVDQPKATEVTTVPAHEWRTIPSEEFCTELVKAKKADKTSRDFAIELYNLEETITNMKPDAAEELVADAQRRVNQKRTQIKSRIKQTAPDFKMPKLRQAERASSAPKLLSILSTADESEE